ncbi:hypothetical protein, partial [Sulfitobacter pontiacus]|uniref:hypothetical protein n=1 Tax=Sulfitobacter pontiacus TaxID=60137 RepID=UPI003296C9C9
MIAGLIFATFAAFAIWLVWDQRRVSKRRKSLHQDISGVWVWTNFDGSEQRSDIHPESPSGAWFCEGPSDGGGGSD